MQNVKVKGLGLAVVFAFVKFVAPPAKEFSLVYNVRKGDRIELHQKTEQEIVQKIMGMDQKGSNSYDGLIAMQVLSAGGSEIRLEAKLTRLKTHMQNFMNETLIDSDGSADVAANRIVQAMMNKPFYVTISTTGKIIKVEDVDTLWAGVDKLDISEDEKTRVKSAIGQMINESSFKNGLGQAFLTYAGKPVHLQEEWTTQGGIPAEFPVRSDNKWFVESATGTHAVVKGNGTFKTFDKDKVVTLPGDLKAKVNLAGSQEVVGSSLIKTGVPAQVVVDGSLSGTIMLLAGGLLPVDLEIPIAIKTHTEYSFLRK